jgi:hypothetical protein
MPCDYSRYPANWFTGIRPRILARAGDRCERCGVPNHTHIARTADGWECALESEEGAVWIILTIAHLDHDVTNNADENLMALCQKCHLIHDARQHATSRRENREKRDGQLTIENARP